MAKVDPKKAEPALYHAPRDHAVRVEVPDETFLMIDGAGSPQSPAFQEAIQALYAVSHGINLLLREKEPGKDHVVMPLEALWWWGEEPSFPEASEHGWRWTLMIRQPDETTPAQARRAAETARERRPLPTLGRVRLERYREGESMQILHVGPYEKELPTIRRLQEEIRAAGFAPAGKHHEIYLGDPRRAKPEGLKTLLRQPIARAA